jgi:arylsulfatase A-like enzyme
MGRFSSPLPPDVAALPELLRPRGYYTGICGRYFHLDGVIDPNPVSADVYSRHKMRTFDRRADWVDRSADAKQPDNLNQFIDKAPRGKPFFLWMNFSDPHHVWDSKEDTYDPARIPLPAHLPDLPGVREDLAKYYAEVTRFDRRFGQVMRVLKDRKQEENTLVLFAGDNGMAFPHGKGSLYDPGLHVPMIARWPGRIRRRYLQPRAHRRCPR